MNARVFGLAVTGAMLVLLGWVVGQQTLPAQMPKGGGESKPGRYQVIGAGLVTAVLFDPETGKTWALSPAGYMGGPDFDGGGPKEYAWAPVTKFDDLDSYRRWVKQQQEKQRERWKDDRFRQEEEARLAEQRAREEARREEERQLKEKQKEFEKKKD